jgi:hypothetical protein
VIDPDHRYSFSFTGLTRMTPAVAVADTPVSVIIWIEYP